MTHRVTPCCKNENWADLDCDECHGSGESNEQDEDGEYETCEECDGDGYVVGEVECLDCGKTYPEHKLIDQEAPHGDQ